MTDATTAAAQDTTAATATTAQSDTTLLTSGTDATTTTAATATDATTATDIAKQDGDQATKDQAATDAAKAKDDSKAQGAPEAYTDFALPEGMNMDADVLGEFTGLAKELNIPQAAAQKLIDLQAKIADKQAQEYQAAVLKQGEQWAAAVKNDPELGGENYDKSVASAVKVIQAFGDPDLRDLLNSSGLGNHPALFKFCHKVSQAISEDKFVLPGNQQDAPKEMSIIDAFK